MASDPLETAIWHAREQGRTAIITFVTVGFPDVATTLELVPALAAAGADIIELGVPFSDPLADGATIQAASFHALGQGVTLRACLDACARLRMQGIKVPLVLMGYYNPLLALGLEAFARTAQESGVQGVIVADLPPEEAEPLLAACRPRGIDWICLLAPTSTEERIATGCALARGFIYCVSLAGVTGVRERVSTQAAQLVQRVRARSSLPVAVGFGISRPEHIRAVAQYADGVVVGSALVDVIRDAPPGQTVAQAARFVQGLRGPSKLVL